MAENKADTKKGSPGSIEDDFRGCVLSFGSGGDICLAGRSLSSYSRLPGFISDSSGGNYLCHC